MCGWCKWPGRYSIFRFNELILSLRINNDGGHLHGLLSHILSIPCFQALEFATRKGLEIQMELTDYKFSSWKI